MEPSSSDQRHSEDMDLDTNLCFGETENLGTLERMSQGDCQEGALSPSASADHGDWPGTWPTDPIDLGWDVSGQEAVGEGAGWDSEADEWHDDCTFFVDSTVPMPPVTPRPPAEEKANVDEVAGGVLGGTGPAPAMLGSLVAQHQLQETGPLAMAIDPTDPQARPSGQGPEKSAHTALQKLQGQIMSMTSARIELSDIEAAVVACDGNTDVVCILDCLVRNRPLLQQQALARNALEQRARQIAASSRRDPELVIQAVEECGMDADDAKIESWCRDAELKTFQLEELRLYSPAARFRQPQRAARLWFMTTTTDSVPGPSQFQHVAQYTRLPEELVMMIVRFNPVQELSELIMKRIWRSVAPTESTLSWSDVPSLMIAYKREAALPWWPPNVSKLLVELSETVFDNPHADWENLTEYAFYRLLPILHESLFGPDAPSKRPASYQRGLFPKRRRYNERR